MARLQVQWIQQPCRKTNLKVYSLYIYIYKIHGCLNKDNTINMLCVSQNLLLLPSVRTTVIKVTRTSVFQAWCYPWSGQTLSQWRDGSRSQDPLFLLALLSACIALWTPAPRAAGQGHWWDCELWNDIKVAVNKDFLHASSDSCISPIQEATGGVVNSAAKCQGDY